MKTKKLNNMSVFTMNKIIINDMPTLRLFMKQRIHL